MAKLDVNKLKEKLEALNSSGNRNNGPSVGFIQINDGRNVVRVLPGKGNSDFYEEVWVHYGVGKSAQNKNGTMVVCPTTHNENASCPVCELARELRSLSQKQDDEYSKQARSVGRKKRVYFNAISRDEDLAKYEKDAEGKWKNTEDDKEGSPVKVLGTGVGIFKDILGLICDPEYGDVTDPEQGLDLIITKSGSGQFNTNYDVKSARRESPVGFDEWEECLHDLKQFSKGKTYDEIAKIMDGGEADDSSSSSDEPESSSKSEDTGSVAPDTEPQESSDSLQDDIKAALAARRANKK